MVTQIPLPQPFKKVTKNSLTLSIKTLRNLVKRISSTKIMKKHFTQPTVMQQMLMISSLKVEK